MTTYADLTYSATKLRAFLIRQMEALGYNCEWSLLSDNDVLIQAADLLDEGEEDAPMPDPINDFNDVCSKHHY